jgi:hypothetical protein
VKGKPDQAIIPFLSTKEIDKRIERLKYIRGRINNYKLPPGEYAIECTTHPRNSPLNVYPIIIPDKPDSITHHVEDKTLEQEELMNFNPEDYKETVMELARKEMKIMALEHEIKFLKSQMKEMEKKTSKPLSDGEEPKTWFDALGKSFSENLPELANLAEKFLSQRDRQLSLAERGYGYKNPVRKTVKSKPKNNMNAILKRMELLQEEDPEEFEKVMDQYAERNRPLHDRICEHLGIEIEEEEELPEEEELEDDELEDDELEEEEE